MNMFLDYQQAILEKFEQKKEANELSLRLMDLSRANLRDECIAVCTARFERKDERTLEAFFGKKENAAEYIKAIEKIDIDKFRPVISFIKGSVSTPAQRSVELVAWLIDFRPRPFKHGDRYPEIQPETISQPIKQPDYEPVNFPQPPVVPTSNGKRKSNPKKLITPVLIFCLLILGAYFVLKNANRKTPVTESCMFWNIDHYERISCEKKMGDIMVIALDTLKLKYFKKIMLPDTITYNSIGKIWYIKLSGKQEFYTSRGTHPLNPVLVLKPITAHIIDTYILSDSLK